MRHSLLTATSAAAVHAPFTPHCHVRRPQCCADLDLRRARDGLRLRRLAHGPRPREGFQDHVALEGRPRTGQVEGIFRPLPSDGGAAAAGRLGAQAGHGVRSHRPAVCATVEAVFMHELVAVRRGYHDLIRVTAIVARAHTLRELQVVHHRAHNLCCFVCCCCCCCCCGCKFCRRCVSAAGSGCFCVLPLSPTPLS